jgi:septum formation protein
MPNSTRSSASRSTLILGSRSPRRLELLSLLVPRDQIEVRAPKSPDEAGFEGLATESEIEHRLQQIARDKSADVAAQFSNDSPAILTADTTIVGWDADGRLAVLGQPPDDDTWPDVVREWFHTYYLGRTHVALTAVCLRTPDGHLHEAVARSEVTFRSADEATLDWYLATGESRGKAGGYGLQGAADVFVERIVGSPSNIVGLPLRETAELLRNWRG